MSSGYLLREEQMTRGEGNAIGRSGKKTMRIFKHIAEFLKNTMYSFGRKIVLTELTASTNFKYQNSDTKREKACTFTLLPQS